MAHVPKFGSKERQRSYIYPIFSLCVHNLIFSSLLSTSIPTNDRNAASVYNVCSGFGPFFRSKRRIFLLSVKTQTNLETFSIGLPSVYYACATLAESMHIRPPSPGYIPSLHSWFIYKQLNHARWLLAIPIYVCLSIPTLPTFHWFTMRGWLIESTFDRKNACQRERDQTAITQLPQWPLLWSAGNRQTVIKYSLNNKMYCLRNDLT